MVSPCCWKDWLASKKLRWVRFLYAYPNKITGKLLDTIASHEKICSYMDVPLQHASASVLKRMKRGGGADVFLRSIEKMRRVQFPMLTLRTSFIVGFPGETEKEFEELCDFVREAQFDWMGAFAYSDQEGAGAYALDKKARPREIERRRKQLMTIQRQISKKKEESAGGARVRSAARRRIGRNRAACWRGEPQCTRRKSTARFSSMTFPKNSSRSRASSTAARLLKRTITIWWQRSFSFDADLLRRGRGVRPLHVRSERLCPESAPSNSAVLSARKQVRDTDA